MLTASLIRTRNFHPRYVEKSTPGWIGHLPFANWLMLDQAPRLAVELGTHFGNSYFTMCQAVAELRSPSQCFAVDCWEGDAQAGSYGGTVFDQVRRHNDEHYIGFSTLLRMNFDEALGEFADGSIDLLHIDGLHTYDAVKHDFETWRPKLSERAIVLFHDIAVEKEDFGVSQFWAELKAGYPAHLEFAHNFGLGVLWARPDSQRGAPAWLRRRSPARILVKRIFSHRGIKLAVAHKSRKSP